MEDVKPLPTQGFFGGALDTFDDAFEDEFFKEDAVNSYSTDSDIDPMLSIPEELYCSIINDLDEACWEVSPAELWSFNRSLINQLTQNDIIHGINHQLIR